MTIKLKGKLIIYIFLSANFMTWDKPFIVIEFRKKPHTQLTGKRKEAPHIRVSFPFSVLYIHIFHFWSYIVTITRVTSSFLRWSL